MKRGAAIERNNELTLHRQDLVAGLQAVALVRLGHVRRGALGDAVDEDRTRPTAVIVWTARWRGSLDIGVAKARLTAALGRRHIELDELAPGRSHVEGLAFCVQRLYFKN